MLTYSSIKLVIGVALSCAVSLSAATLEGRIVGVADGDTVTLLDSANVQHKIRLAGIDAPEKRQAFGARSKQSLAELVFSRSATVETNKKDRYGRYVGKVLVDGRDVNLVQVERGMAWFYREYQAEQSPEDRLLYNAAEKRARGGRNGLWLDVEPEAPWDYRQHRRIPVNVDQSHAN